MKNPILQEIRRVTGWHFLIDHEAFPILLAAISSTTVLWFYPGIHRIAAAYHIPQQGVAAVHMAAPQKMVTSVSVVDTTAEGTVQEVEQL